MTLEKKIASGIDSAFSNPIIPRARIQADRLKELLKMSYKDYLCTQEWQAIRRYMNCLYTSCSLCGDDSGNLHVHHNTYPGRGLETPRDLIVLCGDCHKKYHFGGGVLLSESADYKLDILAKYDDRDLNGSCAFHAMSIAMAAVALEVGLRKKALDASGD